jgi:hypothetical protein
MPTPTIPDGKLFMNATTYTGNGGTQTITNGVAGQSFQPDFVWVKSRSNGAIFHNLFDVIRGAGNRIFSNATNAENAQADSLTAFNSNGFAVGADSGCNESSGSYVGWQWKAGGTAVTNTAGTISSQVSANTTSGFSIVTYSGNSTSGATVGHGLGVAPSMVILKRRNGTEAWPVYHSGMPSAAYYMRLNATDAQDTAASFMNNTAPSSTVFTLGNGGFSNTSGSTYVAYCWAPIAGYSAFGSYTGNGSTDGPFVYLSFRPRFVMIKRTDGVEPWLMIDSVRQTYNAMGPYLLANASDAEGTAAFIDFLSNGFKLRSTGGSFNASGGTYIYMAFAENPFKYANAR